MRFRECLESSTAQYFYCTRAGAPRETNVGRKSVCVFNQLRLSVRSHCFTSVREYCTLRGENPPRSCAASSVLYIYYCMYSLRGGSHEIVYYKKNERPFVELGDDGETAQWKWQKSMQPHFVVCIRSAIPNFRRKSCDFIRRGSELKCL